MKPDPPARTNATLADRPVDRLIDRVVAVLRRDPRMPPLIGEEWRLLFADATARSREELGELIEGMGNIDDAAEALSSKITRSKQKATTKIERAEARP